MKKNSVSFDPIDVFLPFYYRPKSELRSSGIWWESRHVCLNNDGLVHV